MEEQGALKEKLFTWLVMRNRIWTADRLERRNLPRPAACPLCDQAPESVDHLLVQCPFARQVWFLILRAKGLGSLFPAQAASVKAWWCSPAVNQPTIRKKEVTTLLVAGLRKIWLERGSPVFENKSVTAHRVADLAIEEFELWITDLRQGCRQLLERSNPKEADGVTM